MTVYAVTINNGSDEIKYFVSPNKPSPVGRNISLTWVPLVNKQIEHPIYKHIVTSDVLAFLDNPINGVWCYSYD